MTSSNSFRTPNNRDGKPLVVILTALQKEFLAVLSHLVNTFEEVGPNGIVFECGDFESSGQSWKVAIAETSAGNIPASLAASAAMNFFDPDLLMFVGIAGGVKSDTAIGDVVASNRIYYYEGGKDEGEYLARPREIQVISSLVQRAMAVARKTNWIKRLDTSDFPNVPKAVVGAIAAGENVVAAKASNSFLVVKSHYNDALAIEMEGFGAAYTAFHSGKPTLVVRGISDLLDDKETTDRQGSQELATKSAAAFAFEVLANYLVSQPTGQATSSIAAARPPTTTIPTEQHEAPASHKDWMLILESSADEKLEEVKTILEIRLREICKDPNLRVLKISEGSIQATVSSTRPAFEYFSTRVLARVIDEIIGRKVVAVLEIEQTRSDLTLLFQHSSKEMLTWPTTLADSKWLARKELHQLEHLVATQATSFTAVLGSPGSGKSALMAKLAADFAKQGTRVLAIKADSIPSHVDTLEKLGSHLQLSTDPSALVRYSASQQKTVVIIDQLDALSELVDLHSDRLNVLLNFINRVANLPNIHVICSSRVFEFEHDSRLNSIQAGMVTLDLPSWDDVTVVLSELGIDAANWPDNFKEMLRVPQHLKTFIRLGQGPREIELYKSYQRMLEELWQRVVVEGPPGTADFLDRFSLIMSEAETLWLPRSRFDGDLDAIKHLIANGILVQSESGLAIGFSHQTLFDFGRARAFASGAERLFDYVIARQDALFVRPKVWSSLNYLRDADMRSYISELEELWTSPRIRFHIRTLLVDFLGLVEEPTEVEVRLFLSRLKDADFTNRALGAAAGNPHWFDIICDNYLPIIMRLAPSKAWPAAHFLIRAFPFAQEAVLKLIESYWAANSEYDSLVWRVLDSSEDWDDRMAAIGVEILDRSDTHTFSIMHTSTSIAVNRPDLAVKLVAATLGRQLRIAKLEAENAQASQPDSNDWEGQQNWSLREDSRRRVGTILDQSHGWYDLPAVAEAAGKTFIDELWTWLIDLLENIATPRESTNRKFRTEWAISTSFDEDGDYRQVNPIPEAFLVAIRQFAKSSPGKFIEFVNKWKNTDLMFIQRLLALGLKELAASHSSFILNFFLEDDRRFSLGTHRDNHAETKEVLSTLCSHLPPTAIAQLQTAILEWEIYPITPDFKPEDRHDRLKWNRERRLRVLRGLPKSKLSPDIQRLIAEEERAFPHTKDWDSKIEGGFIGSPMAASQMALASEENILELFKELPDTTEWDHPKGWLRGGSIQASRAFAEMAKSDPKKAISVILALPLDAQRPAGYAIDEIAGLEGEYSSCLFEIISTLEERGFATAEYRVSVASALSKLAGRNNGLPDSMLTILESWLHGNWGSVDEPPDSEDERDSSDGTESAIWGNGGVRILPQGTYTVLEALTRALLTVTPPRLDDWRRVVVQHIERPDSVRTWIAFSHHLRWLANLGGDAASEILHALFRRFPSVRASKDGVVLLAYLSRVLGNDEFRSLVLPLRGIKWSLGAQAYGELLMLRLIQKPDDHWTKAEVATIVNSETTQDSAAAKAQGGVAIAAAHLWVEIHSKDELTDILVNLIAMRGDQIAPSLNVIFRQSDRLYADNDTLRILEAIAALPAIVTQLDKLYFVNRIQDLIPMEPDLVFRLSEIALKASGKELADLSTSWSGRASDLVNIAITLQRFEGNTRAKGLTLFEKLLQIEATGARETLLELDGRLLNVPSRPLRARLRRRRR